MSALRIAAIAPMRMLLALCCVVLLASLAGPATARHQPARAGTNGVALPHVLTWVAPVYPPPIASQAQVTGSVALDVVVAPDGRVQQAIVTRSLPLLDETAVRAVRQWTFAPPGTGPDGVIVPVSVQFALDLGPPPTVASASRADDGALPEGFSFRYVIRCRSDSVREVHIDPGGFTVVTSYPPAGVRTESPFTTARMAEVYVRVMAADLSAARTLPVLARAAHRTDMS